MRIHGHFHKLAKLYVSELLFSFIFCPPTFVFLQTIFFSYKAVLIMFGAISALLFIKMGLIMFGVTSTLYSFIIYFCNQGPLLFTKSGAIRYIKIFLLFCAGLLILAFPVNIQRPSTNLLFILFDFVNNAVGFIYKYNGTISVFVTYMICILLKIILISGNHDRLEAGNNIHILSSENKSTTTEDYKANRKQDIEELNRNTENSLNKRKEIFDKTKVEEKQELIQIQADVDKNHKVINSSGTPRTADCIADGTGIKYGERI